MVQRRYNRQVIVDDHLIYLMQPSPEYDETAWPPSSEPQLVVFTPGQLVILTGISYGPVEIEVAVFDDEPPLNLSDWQDIWEGDLISDGSLRVCSGMSGYNLIPGDDRELTPNGPSLDRVRVFATGRNTMYDMPLLDGAPVERYLLEIWPAPGASEFVTYRHHSGV
ncbi:hypothetical protein FOS14_11100 [Skermania sp. ID1734]|uniref:hypothetical protein n=1 Tax=Skermania sp. ID1734 TaxID=2597516 RepID=UPI00117E87D2|nr:hypothetical protein [Skermania sp. ID1734]TSD99788.1 hypothetical protein FOS14_11100 [Skermania sp. ID1734]